MLKARGKSLAAQQVKFFDTTAIFAAETETLFIDDCCHYDEKGNRLLARFILRTILENTRMTGVKGSPSP